MPQNTNPKEVGNLRRQRISVEYGDPGKTRTSDTQFRKLLLYPPELRGHSVCGSSRNFDFTWIRAAVSGNCSSISDLGLWRPGAECDAGGGWSLEQTALWICNQASASVTSANAACNALCSNWEFLRAMSGRLLHAMLAERVGFEPTLEFPLNTLSKRAPSATRPSLRD
jgi:hypothetical protein